MAGMGSRFKNSGIVTPKPLLKIGKKFVFQIAIEALTSKVDAYTLTFVILNAHKREFQIDKKIIMCFPDANIVSIAYPTNGAAETAFCATQSMGECVGGLVIADCDQWIDGIGLKDMFNALSSRKCDIAIPVFHSTNPSYGYIEPGAKRKIEKIVEKKQISGLAVAGCYGFRNVLLFNNLYQGNSDWGLEKYMTSVVRAGIVQKMKVEYFNLDSHIPFGTPTEWRSATINPQLLGVVDEHFE
jgi:dTDP-glucose pyrophosphorylase